MIELLNGPTFGILLTVLAYLSSSWIYSKLRFPLLHPLLVSTVLIITLLGTFSIKYETYNLGGQYFSYLLNPTTVLLAVPLYRQREYLKKHFVPILIGVAIGCISSLTIIYLLSNLLGLDQTITLSLLPKSITTPIGVSISKQIGGITSITIFAIIFTGIMGGTFSETLCKIFRINHPIAQGIAIGSSTHAVGTAKALQMGELQGAMSGLAIGLAGIITAIITPIFLLFFHF